MMWISYTECTSVTLTYKYYIYIAQEMLPIFT